MSGIASNSSVAVCFDQFSYSYPSAGRPALRRISLSIDRGEFVLVCGASGAGKTTLLHAASGLVPHFFGGLAAGDVTVLGRDLREHRADTIAEVCGSLFQDPESQVVMSGVRAELALPLENAGWSPAKIARGVQEVALALGISHLLDRRTDELSGGELQRVALAAALAPRPPLLVLDEPTAQLDPAAADELIAMLHRLNDEWGVAVLIADHRTERLLAHADRVVTIADGELAHTGTPDEFLVWAAANAHDDLLTPAAQAFRTVGLTPLPSGVKQARQTLSARDLLAPGAPGVVGELEAQISGNARGRLAGKFGRSPSGESEDDQDRKTSSNIKAGAALSLKRVWFEHHDGPEVLHGINLEIQPGERVALMGANGVGKSTLMRVAKGLVQASRGSVKSSGEIGLLLQNPNDYFLYDTVREEASAGSLRRFGLAGFEDRDPRALSGGQRQRLALAIVMDSRPAVLLLDEPTRGMDRSHRRALSSSVTELAAQGTAVVVATHDADFAATIADRVVLMADGEVIADGPVAEILSGGWYFTTEIARIFGEDAAAVTAQDAVELLRRRIFERSDQTVSVKTELEAR